MRTLSGKQQDLQEGIQTNATGFPKGWVGFSFVLCCCIQVRLETPEQQVQICCFADPKGLRCPI